MERRQVFAQIIGPLAGLGGVALVASLNVPDYAEFLRAAGIGAICASAGTWLGLLLTAEKKRPSVERGFVSVPDAGDWLYIRGSAALRGWLNRFVPDTFNSVRDHATQQVHAAATEGVCQLYERRDVGLPLEKIEAGDCDPAMLMDSESTAMAQVFMKRSELKKVLKFTEAAIATQIANLSAQGRGRT